MCEKLAEYFLYVYCPDLSNGLMDDFRTPFFFSECALTVEDVKIKLVALDPFKGS